MELKRDDIIKVLECCIEQEYCATCPCDNECIDIDSLIANALSLIKELTEENERLRAIPEELHKEMSERMVEERKIERKLTVRKMQELIEGRLDISANGYSTDEVKGMVFDTIDQIAKEMLEGENESVDCSR